MAAETRAELLALVRQAGSVAGVIDCPGCGRKAGEWCVNIYGSTRARRPGHNHRSRVTAWYRRLSLAKP